MLPDAIYTPPALARRLVGAAKAGFTPKTIVDITAGHGELLRATEVKWRHAEIHAWDIDSKVTAKLRRSHPTWEVQTVDALSVSPSQKLYEFFDLVVLNPPFSCRGGAFYSAEIDAKIFRCSRAGQFLVKGLSLLRENGQLLAILPVGTLENDKDLLLWQNINRFYRARVITENCPKAFPGLRIRTIIVRLTRRPKPIEVENRAEKIAPPFLQIRGLQRGSCPARLGGAFLPGSTRFLHTTDIKMNKLLSSDKRYVKWHWSIKGPLVLIPRVGNPNCIKVACYIEPTKVVISDCLFALSCSSKRDAISLASKLRARWNDVRRLYKGTCAQFLTIQRLQAFLVSNKFSTKLQVRED